MNSSFTTGLVYFLGLVLLSNGQWIHINQKDLCPAVPDTRFDALGRRESQLLIPPESQGSCGNCWAFASTHVFADQLNIYANGTIFAFSPDLLTRCSPFSEEGNGCCGGSPFASIKYLQMTGAYPNSTYTLGQYSIPTSVRKNRTARLQFKSNNPLICPNDTNSSSVRLVGYVKLDSRNISSVIAAIDKGPVYARIFIPTGNLTLSRYACGVYTDPDPLPGNNGGHAIELVDYSSPSYNGTPFYVAKNSWGMRGERGFFRIVQNSTLFKRDFYSYIVSNDSTYTEVATDLLPDSVDEGDCAAEIETDKNSFVEEVIRYGLQVLPNQGGLICQIGDGKPALQLDSIISYTLQVVEGFIIDVTVNVNVKQCGEDSAVVKLVVLQNFNGSFTLLDYTYSPSPPNKAAYSTFSSGVLVLLLICTYI